MCGIVGFVGSGSGKEVSLKRMMRQIRHRGPDESGIFIDEDIALGHLRLSIIDIKNGKQPMKTEDEKLIISFNGEIYNYLELKRALESFGYKFKTSCDTEVLLYGYQHYGKKILNKLRGMFAFVIWNQETKELFGARDFFGIKPLYYYLNNNSFLFASEIKAFFPNKNFVKKLNENLLPNYLNFGFVPTRETFFNNVFSLEPGHYFIYKDNKLRIKRYFKINFDEKLKTVEEFSKSIDKCMRDSIEKHKISDVEVGAFLSGGVDSSYIVALGRPNKTFTIGYKENKYNEGSHAKRFAKSLNLDNKCVFVDKEEYFSHLNKVLYHMDEPVSDPSIIPLYLISKFASKHVKVILSGEGADELFGGYNYYKTFNSYKFYDKIPFPIRNVISKACRFMPDIKGVNFLTRRGEKLEDDYIGVNKIFNDIESENILNKTYNHPKNKDLTENIYKNIKNKSKVSAMQMVDLNFWFVKDILQKADKMSMANSIEVRVPFVDKEVFNIARKLPEYAKVSKTMTKIAMRKACAKVIASDCNKEKLGFPVPIREWMKQSDVYNVIKNKFESEDSLKFFNHNKIMKLLNETHSGLRDNYKKVWTVYVFLVWYDLFFK